MGYKDVAPRFLSPRPWPRKKKAIENHGKLPNSCIFLALEPHLFPIFVRLWSKIRVFLLLKSVLPNIQLFNETTLMTFGDRELQL